ncbi:MAG: pyridoxal 5'-phosphate synthase glutaminase subunit PdxT [Acidimicrobiales bacterium]
MNWISTSKTAVGRPPRVNVGVLALQGAFARHVGVLRGLGVETTEVRVASDLAVVDRLVMPGGESTAMSNLLASNELYEPLADRLSAGMPVFGTCAGMILLASSILDGRDDQRCFGAIDIDVRRNAFGRQIDSFEADLDVTGLDSPLRAVFIRAPVVERVGAAVDVLASVDGQPVLCREASTMVAAFHPELSDDRRLHQIFLTIS